MTDGPLVSVIIPVRNAATTIDVQLGALASQTYRGQWEVVLSDNGSTDDTVARARTWEGEVPTLRVVDASGPASVGQGRNVGIAQAAGDLILICDGDDEVAPDWVEEMVAALADHPLVTGHLDVTMLNEPEQYLWPGHADAEGLEIPFDFLPYAPGGNLGMRREVFDKVGQFDLAIPRCDDIDFSWRAAYAGIPVHHQPTAVIFHRLRDRPWPLARTAYYDGIDEGLIYRRHRVHGARREPWSTTASTWWWLVTSAPAAVRGVDRCRWAWHAGRRVGRIAGSIRHRVLLL